MYKWVVYCWKRAFSALKVLDVCTHLSHLQTHTTGIWTIPLHVQYYSILLTVFVRGLLFCPIQLSRLSEHIHSCFSFPPCIIPIGLGVALTWNLLLLCGFPDCYIAIHLDIDLYRRSSLIDILEAHCYIVITEE